MTQPDRLRRQVSFFFAGIVLLTAVVGIVALFRGGAPGGDDDEFTRFAHQGKNYLDRGEAAKAVTAFTEAVKLQPTHPDAHLNLANALLRANQPERAIASAQAVLDRDANVAAAYYVMGCAQLRLGQSDAAIKSLQQAKEIDRTINAVSFQLGRALQQAGQFDAAREQFEEVVRFEPEHPAAWYNLSQVLVRLSQTDAANQALAQHQKLAAGKAGQITDPAVFERCKYTEARAPVRLEEPSPEGNRITFADMTAAAFAAVPGSPRGPAGVIDFERKGQNHLFVAVSNGFRVLVNAKGLFNPTPHVFTNLPGVKYTRCLVGDLNNDQVEDVLMLGDTGSQVFKFTTNGLATDQSAFSKMKATGAADGFLGDFEFAGRLDLLAITPGTNGVRPLRNFGQPYFTDSTNWGLPPGLSGVRDVCIEDWNNDDLLDLFIARAGQPPLVLLKVRGGAFTPTNTPADWPAGNVLATGDFNNDLRADLFVAATNQIVGLFNGVTERATIALGAWTVRALAVIDFDNDGWLDLLAAGDGVRMWRNRGRAGFKEVTSAVGFDRTGRGAIAAITPADLDQDCDTDLLLAREDGTLQLLRNDGGNANFQLKPILAGRRSNASGLGVRVDVAAGGLRLFRRASALPMEIGVGRHAQLDSLTARWSSLVINSADVKVDPCAPVPMEELLVPDGSCPYLYAWDGHGFRFVTDLLGAAPAGLRLTETRLIDSDPDEYVWIGDEKMFPQRAGRWVVQITEELREVLYLDEAKLVVVDHPAGTEVHTTGKLRPGKPFPRHELVTLHQRRPLRAALADDARDVTALLLDADAKFVSPARVRPTQLAGLAEPHSITLDFGPLSGEAPLVLALTGWLRFGGGTVNYAASQNPELPFPFPRLEAEVAPSVWQAVDVVVGAPCGKTKTILVDLAGRLPAGARRLRVATAFEIHWDRAALFEKRDNAETRVTILSPNETDLHWRGFGEFEPLPWYHPLTPSYARVRDEPLWRGTVSGWCTRYGAVDELVAQRDNALVLVNGGDELTLEFAGTGVATKPAGSVRDFFLFTSGWDKDADFHNARGDRVEPIPWHGMDDQRYGQEERPALANDDWMKRYNTRWVGPRVLTRVRR